MIDNSVKSLFNKIECIKGCRSVQVDLWLDKEFKNGDGSGDGDKVIREICRRIPHSFTRFAPKF